MAPNPKPVELLQALQARAAGKKLVLHVGSGAPSEKLLHPQFNGAEWFEVRCDRDKAVRPHILTPLQDLSMLPSASLDAVWSTVLERLDAKSVLPALAEWLRVLKPGGQLVLRGSDLRAVAAHVAHGRLDDILYHATTGPVSAHDRIYGAGNPLRAHRSGFTAETLAKKLIAAGFSNIVVRCVQLGLEVEALRLNADDKNRVARARIVRDKQNDVAPPPAPPLSAQRHPGALWPGKRADELDVPPTAP